MHRTAVAAVAAALLRWPHCTPPSPLLAAAAAAAAVAAQAQQPRRWWWGYTQEAGLRVAQMPLYMAAAAGAWS
eukprot:1159640-Pelagomonas_calceolata.AAC.15